MFKEIIEIVLNFIEVLIIKLIIENGKEIISRFSSIYQKHVKPLILSIRSRTINFNQQLLLSFNKPRSIKKTFTFVGILTTFGQVAFVSAVIIALVFAAMIYHVKLNQGIPFYEITSIFSILITFIVIGAIITFPRDSYKE